MMSCNREGKEIDGQIRLDREAANVSRTNQLLPPLGDLARNLELALAQFLLLAPKLLFLEPGRDRSTVR